MRVNGKLQCDMDKQCGASITMIDRNGFIYCTDHGLKRRGWKPCRKLLKREIAALEYGATISWEKSTRASDIAAQPFGSSDIGSIIGTPEEAARIARPVMRMAEQETFVVLCLSIRNTLLAPPFVVAIGSVANVEVHPRDVFREGIKRNAAGMVLLHNHPSGDPTPSTDDIAITKRLRAAGEIIGIPIVDHVVVTVDHYYSLSEGGLLS